MAGETAPYGEELFQRKLLERGILLQKMIEIINICLEMAVVMKVHRFFVDEGFKSVVTVWEGSVYEWIIIVSIHIKALPDRAF